jgi:endonuclease III
MSFYWKVSKGFLVYIEDSMSHDSLLGSKISTRSKKNVSCNRKLLLQVFFRMILRHQKYQKKTTHMIFTLRTSIMHFYPNLILKDTGTMLRRNLKKMGIMQVKNSIISQTIYYLYDNGQGKSTDNVSFKE